MDRMTRDELVSKAADAGLAVGTWAPGDGHTRYRFFAGDDPALLGDSHSGHADYDVAFGLYTAHGIAEACGWLRGYRAARQVLLAPPPTPATVHLVIEEQESGTDANGGTYCVLSAHATQADADAAVDAWRASHEACCPPPPDEDEDRWENGWCSCGIGVTQEEVQVTA